MNADEPITDRPDRDEEKTQYVMIPKTYSEQVKVTPEGALNETTVRSQCVYRGSQHYKTSLECIPRMIPIHHINTVLTDGEEVIYKDYIYFSTQMKPKSFSESVYNHPKKLETKYRTTFTHWDNYKNKWFVAGVEIMPAIRLTNPKLPIQCLPACSETTEDKSEMINGLVNGIDREITVM